MYVVYSNNEEVIICTTFDEQQCVKDYFKEGGRNLEDYDRAESKDPVSFTVKINRDF